MSFIPFTRGERIWLALSLVAAILLGCLAGYAAFTGEKEAQFHGGILEEDAAEAKTALLREFSVAFLKWSAGGIAIAGLVPITIRRILTRSGK